MGWIFNDVKAIKRVLSRREWVAKLGSLYEARDWFRILPFWKEA